MTPFPFVQMIGAGPGVPGAESVATATREPPGVRPRTTLQNACHELSADEPRSVLGEPLEPCGNDPVTGFYRDGCCTSGPEDLGSHTVCAVVTAEFLEHQR